MHSSKAERRTAGALLSKGTVLARLVAGASSMQRALRDYAEAEIAAYEDSLAVHCHMYARERRWPCSVFWGRQNGLLRAGGYLPVFTNCMH